MRPNTRHWAKSDAILDLINGRFNISSYDDFRARFGSRRLSNFLRDNMGAVWHKVGGSKQLFIPGLQSNYHLKELVSFLTDVSQHSRDVALSVALRTNSRASIDLLI
jgi:hypothetical protein